MPQDEPMHDSTEDAVPENVIEPPCPPLGEVGDNALAQELEEQNMTSDEDVAETQNNSLVSVVEALLLSSESALTIDQMIGSFEASNRPERKQVRDALHSLDAQLAGRAVELREVASGWRIQVRQGYAAYIGRLWEERPPRYSRALLETLALIVYRQPISRGEIEEIRGVSLSPGIIKTLVERDWVKVVGVREAPGRPELLGTTKVFLDDFNLKSLNELPSLPEIRDPDALGEALKRLGIEPDEAEPEEEGDQPDLLTASASPGTDDASADDLEFGVDLDEDVDETDAPDAKTEATLPTDESEADEDQDLPAAQANRA